MIFPWSYITSFSSNRAPSVMGTQADKKQGVVQMQSSGLDLLALPLVPSARSIIRTISVTKLMWILSMFCGTCTGHGAADAVIPAQWQENSPCGKHSRSHAKSGTRVQRAYGIRCRGGTANRPASSWSAAAGTCARAAGT